MMRGARVVTMAAAAAISVGAAPQDPPRQVFRSAVDLVTIVVVVVDDEGRPVRGLGPDDFTVRLDGQRRPVRALDYRESLAPGAADERPSAPAANRATATAQAGRVIMLLFDDLSFPTASTTLPALRLAAERMLQHVTPYDRVGVATTSQRGEVVRPTTDRARVGAAIRRVAGWTLPTSAAGLYVSIAEAVEVVRSGLRGDTLGEVMDRECRQQGIDDLDVCQMVIDGQARMILNETKDRTARQIGGYEHTLASLAAEPSPRVLVLFSEGLITGGVIGYNADLTQVARVAAQANVQLYAVLSESDGSTVTERIALRVGIRADEVSLFQDGVKSVAGAVGGALFRLVGRPDRLLERVLLESSGVYEIGVDAPPGDNRLPEVVVSVDRPGVTVRANRRAVVSGAPPAPPAPIDEVRRVLVEGRIALGVPLSVAASSRRDPSGRDLQLAVDLAVPASVVAPLDVAFAIVDADGRTVKAGTGTVPDERPTGDHRFTFALPLAAGEYRVRVAVTDADGRVGGVEHAVSLRLRPVGRFLASDLQTGWIDREGLRRFLGLSRLPEAAVAADIGLELYSEPGDRTGTIQIRIDVGAVGRTEQIGSATFEPQEVSGRRTLHTTVPIEALPAGLYTVRATVLEDGAPVGSLSTTIEKVVEAPPADAESRLPRREDVLATLAAELRARRDAFDAAPLFEPRVVRAGLRALAGSAREALPPALGDEGAAEAAFWDAVSAAARESRNALGAMARGLLNLRLGNLPAALAQFELAVERAPASTAAMLYLGAAHAAIGRDEGAVGAWQLALADPTIGLEWHLARADALARIGDRAAAAAVLRPLVARRSESPDLARRLVQVDLAEGRPDAARAQLDHLVERVPDDDDLRWWQLVLAFADAVVPDAPAVTRQAFVDLADRYLDRDGPHAPLVRNWLALIQH